MDYTITSLVPMLETWDMEATIAFYSSLGFDVTGKSEGWCMMMRNDAAIMFSAPNDHMQHKRAGCSGSFYFRITGVEALWNELRGTADISYPLETFDYGMKEFAIFDNNGYLLQFGEPT